MTARPFTQQQLMSPWACEVCNSVAMLPSSLSPLDEPIGAGCQTEEGCDLQSGLASLRASECDTLVCARQQHRCVLHLCNMTWLRLQLEPWIMSYRHAKPETRKKEVQCWTYSTYHSLLFLKTHPHCCQVLLQYYFVHYCWTLGLTSVLMRAGVIISALKC